MFAFILTKEQLFVITIPATLERAFEMEMNILEEITKEKILELISKMDARELRLLLYFMKGRRRNGKLHRCNKKASWNRRVDSRGFLYLYKYISCDMI